MEGDALGSLLSHKLMVPMGHYDDAFEIFFQDDAFNVFFSIYQYQYTLISRKNLICSLR